MHWAEYAIEGALLGVFMVCACVSVAVVEHPGSPVRRAIRSGLARRGVVGIAMGLTAVGLIYSGWGMRSGAHMNPAVTLAFAALGKIPIVDAIMYIAAQFVGGALGVLACAAFMGRAVRHRSVNYVATDAGARGVRGAWATEFGISFGLMATVLVMSNSGAAPFTGVAAGALVAAYIALAAPLSGMSMNPARSLASTLFARNWRNLWVYFTAPVAGMLAAAGAYVSAPIGGHAVCAKLCHDQGECIFHCERPQAARR